MFLLLFAVWPDVAKLRHSASFSSVFVNFWVFIDYLAEIWAFFGIKNLLLSQFSLLQIAKYWSNNLAIWSHCLFDLDISVDAQYLCLELYGVISQFVHTVLPLQVYSHCPSAQCDQIGWFFKVLGDKLSFKSSPNIWWLFGVFWKHYFFGKTCCGYFFGQVYKKLGYFLFLYLVTLYPTPLQSRFCLKGRE